MPKTITLTNGVTYVAQLEVWDDLHSEHPKRYRLFWVNPGESCGTPAIGYCESGGSYKTIKAAVADGKRRFNETAVRTR